MNESLKMREDHNMGNGYEKIDKKMSSLTIKSDWRSRKGICTSPVLVHDSGVLGGSLELAHGSESLRGTAFNIELKITTKENEADDKGTR